MDLEEFYKENLRLNLAAVVSLIDECHALQFSVRMISSLLFYKSDNIYSVMQPRSHGLEFRELNSVDAILLIKELRASLYKLNTKVKSLISGEETNIFGFSISYSECSREECLLLLKELDDNLSLLDAMKCYCARLNNLD